LSFEINHGNILKEPLVTQTAHW